MLTVDFIYLKMYMLPFCDNRQVPTYVPSPLIPRTEETCAWMDIKAIIVDLRIETLKSPGEDKLLEKLVLVGKEDSKLRTTETEVAVVECWMSE